jgi:hypothetical protein
MKSEQPTPESAPDSDHKKEDIPDKSHDSEEHEVEVVDEDPTQRLLEVNEVSTSRFNIPFSQTTLIRILLFLFLTGVVLAIVVVFHEEISFLLGVFAIFSHFSDYSLLD